MMLAAGSAPVADASPSDKLAWEPVLHDWFENAPDALTHSSACWLLRRWKRRLPELSVSKRPMANCDWHVNGVGMTMLRIPAGSFVRRDSPAPDNANDPTVYVEQSVTLAEPFLLADCEVTRAQFQLFIDDSDYPSAEKPTNWRGTNAEYSPTEHHPVHLVDWYDAVLFCNWLSPP